MDDRWDGMGMSRDTDGIDAAEEGGRDMFTKDKTRIRTPPVVTTLSLLISSIPIFTSHFLINTILSPTAIQKH